MQIIFFATLADLHEWFAKNHDTAQELHVGFYKKSAKKEGVTYPEAVDEALCFGWIDGVRHKIDEDSYTNRFTPRKPRSNWSAVNLKKVADLIEAGRMQPSGMKVYEQRDLKKTQQYSFENRPQKLPEADEKIFQENVEAWAFFQAQPPSYQRTAIWWVVSAKKAETQQKRLGILIENSANGERIPLLRKSEK